MSCLCLFVFLVLFGTIMHMGAKGESFWGLFLGSDAFSG